MKTYLLRTKIDIGLFIMRLGLGFQLAMHGYPKIMGGPEKWVKLGSSMSMLGIGFGFTFWGFMAAFAEFVGGILIILGLFTRISSMLIAFTMLVAALHHWTETGAKWMDGSNAFELMVAFIALYFTGAGKYSLDRIWLHKM